MPIMEQILEAKSKEVQNNSAKTKQKVLQRCVKTSSAQRRLGGFTKSVRYHEKR